MSNTRGAIAAAKVQGGKGRRTVGFDSASTGARPGSSENQGGLPSAPRTRQSVAPNPQATTVASARDAKRNAAIALAGQREAEKRARKLHLERLRDDARAEEERLERARVAEEQRREKERIEEQRLEEEMRLEAERLARLEAERLARLEAERLARLEAERLARLEAERLAEEHRLNERRIEEVVAEWVASEAAPYDLTDVPDMARGAYQLFWNSASTTMRQDEIRATLLAADGVPRSERQRTWVEHFRATRLQVNRSMHRRWGSSFVLKEDLGHGRICGRSESCLVDAVCNAARRLGVDLNVSAMRK
eukprot:6193114-Pleurochrysis_carterae.AAC.2